MMYAAAAIPPVWDRAVAYGDGLFETVAVFAGNAPLWPLHKQRLQCGVQRLQITCDLAAIERDFLRQANSNPESLIKIIVARSGGPRGYDMRKSPGCAVEIRAYPLPHYPSSHRHDGVRLHLCRQRLAQNSALAGLKHLDRLEQVMAAGERDRAMTEEGLMLDSSGAVIEGIASNIFIFRDGRLQTPQLDQCGVAGTMRSLILHDLAPDLSLPVQQCRLTIANILSADAVFICNSVFGIWPVSTIGVSQTARLPSLIEKLWRPLDAMGYARLYG